MRSISGEKMKRAVIITALCFSFILAVSTNARAAKYYKYKDSSGAVHYVDSPDKVPAKYRGQLEVTELGKGKIVSIPERWFNFTGDFKQVLSVDFNKLFLEASLKSRALFWAAGEIILLIAFVVGIMLVRDIPTRKERTLYSWAVLIGFTAWIILSLPLGMRPSARSFCSMSRSYLALVREDQRVPSSYRSRAHDLEIKILSLQNKIP